MPTLIIASLFIIHFMVSLVLELLTWGIVILFLPKSLTPRGISKWNNPFHSHGLNHSDAEVISYNYLFNRYFYLLKKAGAHTMTIRTEHVPLLFVLSPVSPSLSLAGSIRPK